MESIPRRRLKSMVSGMKGVGGQFEIVRLRIDEWHHNSKDYRDGENAMTYVVRHFTVQTVFLVGCSLVSLTKNAEYAMGDAVPLAELYLKEQHWVRFPLCYVEGQGLDEHKQKVIVRVLEVFSGNRKQGQVIEIESGSLHEDPPYIYLPNYSEVGKRYLMMENHLEKQSVSLRQLPQSQAEYLLEL